MTLPTPRLLLTSLINTLTSSPSPTTNVAPAQSGINRPYSAQLQKEETPSNSNNNNNPLKALDREQKALLSTLHVLLPPPMLLQALDLLDRGLVIRVIEHEHHDPHEKPPPSSQSITRDTETEPLAHPPPPQQADDDDDAHLPAQPPASSSSSSPGRRSPKAGSATAIRKRNQFFQVRSSQQPHPRKRRSRDPLSSAAAAAAATTTGSKTYIVRLTSWNCSCAAFTFSSYPSSLGGPNSPSCSAPWAVLGGGEGRAESLGGLRDGREGEGWWEFGGLSYDGVVGEGAGGSVPVCKHLLACLLGEKWDVLRGYVKERAVNREEMAGLAGE